MKITNKQLKQIIKEEISFFINEASVPPEKRGKGPGVLRDENFLYAISLFEKYIQFLKNKFPNIDIDDLMDAGYEFVDSIGYTTETIELGDKLSERQLRELYRHANNPDNY